jgi:hypothetical protein
MACTTTLQQVVNLTSTHADLMPLSGVAGYNNEPALSLCNDTLQELLSHPHDWKFNRRDWLSFVTAQCQQDYKIAGATAFTLGTNLTNNTGVQSAGAQIDLATNDAITVADGVVTVNIIQGQMPHQLTVGATVYMTGVVMTTGNAAAYNAVQIQNASEFTWVGAIGAVITAVTATSFSFNALTGQNNGDVGGAPGIFDYGWLGSCTCTELNNNSSVGNIRPMEAVRNLALSQRVNNPTKMCVLQTYKTATGADSGVIRVRLENPCGSDIWTVNPVYQAKAPLLTSLNDTWSPFPDEYGYVYRQMLIARMYRYINSTQQVAEFQKAEAAIAKATGADDREMSDVHVYPESSLVDGTWYGYIW